jgi:TolB-like protein
MDLTAAPYGGARYPVEARFPQFPARLYNPGVLFGKRVCQSKEPSGQESHGAAVPSNDLIEAELKKVLSSQIFVNSPQLCRFLRFIVEQEIAGEGAGLKEYVLGIEVLKKDESFDPRIDTAVRTEARRLRQKLAEYYQAEGRNDSIEIALPKGSYRATFHTRPLSGSPISAAPSQPTRVPQTRIALGALLCIAGVGAWWLWTSVSAKPHLPSIAVIPLENLSADPEQEYFSDGMTDALFTDLAKLHGLSVISRTSVMQYKRTKKPIIQIARELKVDYVVEGTVTRAGGRIRISAQLIAVPTDRHVWAESYERAATDILTLQGELARAIAEQVHIHVTPQEQKRLTGRPVDIEAQDLYMKGRFNWQTRDPGRMHDSIELFTQAIAKDPAYALPYVGLADSYAVLSFWSDKKDDIAEACRAARKAIELDANLGEAYASLDSCVDQWDWHQREEHFRRALGLSPSYPTAHQWYGAMLIDMGRAREGLAEMRRAVELDPLGPSPNNALGMSLYFTRQYDDSIRQCQQNLEVFSAYVESYNCLGFAYIAKGMYPQSIAAIEKAAAITGAPPPIAGLLASARALGGDRNAVPRLLQEFTGRDVSPVVRALLYHVAGDRDRTFEWLDRAVEQRSFASETIAIHPMLESLHSDSRWKALLRKMNLPLS